MPDRLARRDVTDDIAGKTAANGVDCTVSELDDCPPSGLERHAPSGLGENRIEATNRRLGASPRDTLDKARETVEPWVERKNPDELEDAAECRQRQDTVGIIELITCPARGCGERSEQQNPDDADRYVVDDMRQCRAPHR